MVSIDKGNLADKILLCAVLAAIMIGAWAFFFITAPRALRFVPHQDVFTSNKKPGISIKWRPLFFEHLEPISVRLDGRDVTELLDVRSNEVSFKPVTTLNDGSHHVSTQLRYRLFFTRSVNLKWTFNVDTKAPYIELGNNGVLGIKDAKAEISGLTDPSSRIKVRFNGKQLPSPSVYGGGTFFINLDLISNENKLEIEATDNAGNKAYKSLRVVIDKEPPVISAFLPDMRKKVRNAAPQIQAAIQEKDSEVSGVAFKINNLKAQGQYDSVARRVTADSSDLAEGKNIVELEVKDAAGNVATASWSFIVDSTEEFGKRNLMEGAAGADVKELQARLLVQGFNSGKMIGQYDSGTVQAVKAFQAANQIAGTGTVGPEELRLLKPEKLDISKPIPDGRIVIYLSRRALQLYSGDKLAKVYPIAVGRGGRFKSPVGKHKIREKIVNPTWYPPAWAGISHPIAPGPNNPLGNREMKLSKKGYSIHGTNKPISIGSPVTHGCIRMYPSDVLELFEVVRVGTPVEIKP